MGWRFSIKTIYGVIMLTVFLQIGHDFMINFGMTHPGEFDIIYKQMPQIVRQDAFMSTILGADWASSFFPTALQAVRTSLQLLSTNTKTSRWAR